MSFAQTVRGAAANIAQGGDPRAAVTDALSEGAEGFGLDPGDFLAAREQGASTGSRIEQKTTSLNNAGEALNQSTFERGSDVPVNVICPMVIPRGRTFAALLPSILLVVVGAVGLAVTALPLGFLLNPFFGPHYWLVLLLFTAFMWGRQGMVIVRDACQAPNNRSGELAQIVSRDRVTLDHPLKRACYSLNSARVSPSSRHSRGP